MKIEIKQNTNTMGSSKALLRAKFMVINTNIKNKEKSQINNLYLHLQDLEKENTNSNVSIRQEITKIIGEIHETEFKKTIEKI